MSARRAVALCLFLPALMVAAEPPAIRRQGVVNAASQRPAAAGGAIARGSLISIHGIHFAASAQANRIVLASAEGSRALTVLHADQQRLDAWIPPDAPLGPARLTLISGGMESAPEAIVILKSAPGLFSANGEGWGPARSTNTPRNPVAPGGRVTIEATGIGPADKPEIRVGNATARVLSIHAPKAPNFIAEITLETPPNAPEGCYVPVSARLPGAPPSNTVTVSIHRGGGGCVGADSDLTGGGIGGKTGILLLSRTVRRTFDKPEERIEDEVAGAFTDVPVSGSSSGPRLLLPPSGACATYTGVLRADTPIDSSVWTLLFGGVMRQGLDAGASIVIHSRSAQLRVPFVNGVAGLYRRILSADVGRIAPRSRLSLDSPRFGIAGSGGSQVGPFTFTLPAPAPFEAPNPPADRMGRAQALTVEWSGANPAPPVAIVLLSSNPNLNVVGLVYCSAAGGAGRFTVPADLVAQLPAGHGDLVLASWWGQTLTPRPSGISRMTGLSVFARSWEVRIE